MQELINEYIYARKYEHKCIASKIQRLETAYTVLKIGGTTLPHEPANGELEACMPQANSMTLLSIH